MNTKKNIVLLALTLLGVHVAPAQTPGSDVMVTLKGSGGQSATYTYGNGRVDDVTVNLNVNMHFHPYSPQPNGPVVPGSLFSSTLADFNGEIDVVSMATEIYGGSSVTDDYQNDATYTNYTAFATAMTFFSSNGAVASLSLAIIPNPSTIPTNQLQPYRLFYNGTNGWLTNWIRLPSPFIYEPYPSDDEAWVIPCTVTVTGNGSSFKGFVKDASTGNVLPGATVVIGGQTFTTDASGSFFVPYLPPGLLTVQITDSGYVTYQNTATLPAFSAITNTFKLNAALVLDGYVYKIGPPETPDPGVSISLQSTAPTLTTTTDSSGHYEFDGLSPGAYTLTPNASGHTFQPSSQTLNLTISTTAPPFIDQGQPAITALRVNPPQAHVSASDGIDDAIVPANDPNVLSTALPLGLGVVADDVTPVLFQFSGSAANYTLEITHNASAYNNGTLAGKLSVLQGGQWSSTTGLTPSSFAGGSTAYIYLSGLTWTDFSGTPTIGVTVTLNVYPEGSTSVIASSSFFVRPPPVVLVHGIADDASTWSPAFTSALAHYKPPDFIITINYGIGATLIKQSWPNVWEPFDVLSREADVQLTSAESQIKQNWAFTRYDVVGHSQGGVLARMLCQTNLTGGSAFGATCDAVVSMNNYYRGRFRRVITIGSPHNGTLIVWYLLQLLDSSDAENKSFVLNFLSKLTSTLGPFLIEKFDPFGPQISRINSVIYPVDSRIRFNCIQTAITGGAPPIQTFYPLAAPGCYYLSGLCFPSQLSGESRGQVILPDGSDGVVDYDSQGGRIGTITTQIRDNNIAHADLPNLQVFGLDLSFFGVPEGQSQTTYAEVGTTVGQLLNGPDSTFGPFQLPSLLTPADEQRYSSALALGDFVGNLISFLPLALDATTNVNLAFQVPGNLPNAGPINWFAQTFGTNGFSTNGVLLSVNTNDSTKITVSVDTTVQGQVVLYASYWATNGTLVIANPVVVFSNDPTLTGIQLDPSSVALSVGDTVSLNIWGICADSTSNLLYVPFAQAEYSSSNTNVASVDPSGTITMKSGGAATITASFHGFTAQTLVSSITPFITSQPQNEAVVVGSNSTFSVTAEGFSPLVYQWLLDGTNVVGATNSLLVVSNVQSSGLGSYTVVVSNLFGSTTSSVATVTVGLPLLTATLQANAVQLQFTGTPGVSYLLLAATNLAPPIVWQPVFTNMADANGNWTFTDTNTLSSSARFYQMSLQ